MALIGDGLLRESDEHMGIDRLNQEYESDLSIHRAATGSKSSKLSLNYELHRNIPHAALGSKNLRSSPNYEKELGYKWVPMDLNQASESRCSCSHSEWG